MKKSAPIIITLAAVAIAVGAYYYAKRSTGGSGSSNKPVGMIVSRAEAVPKPFTEEEIAAFTTQQNEKPQDEILKAATLMVFGRYKGLMEQEAVDALIKVLAAQSLNAESWTIIAPKGEKKAAIVKLENQTYKYLDPHLGVVAVFKGKTIIGPYAARFLMSGGSEHDEVFEELNENANSEFYRDFAHVMMAPPGSPVYIHVAAPVFQDPIVLGELDGSAEDVAASASIMQLTPYLDYIGRKHGEKVERLIYFTDPARVTMTLTKPYDPAVMTANIEPQVDGNTVSFDVPQDEPLILHDLSDDFIDVDQLVIKPL